MPFRLTATGNKRFLTIQGDTFVGKSLEVYGEWCHGEIELFQALLGQDSNVVEVGANIGAHTIFIAKDLCSKGVLYAFEPRRIFFQLLCANLMLNDVLNVMAYQKAVGREPQKLHEAPIPLGLEVNYGSLAMGSLPGTGEMVEVVPLDTMLDEIVKIDLLKVDVEGWEVNVLDGSRALIERDRPILHVENERPEKSRALLECLHQFNYDMWWHVVRYFRPNNRTRNTENIFGNTVSVNMLCVPRERRLRIQGAALKLVDDFDYYPVGR